MVDRDVDSELSYPFITIDLNTGEKVGGGWKFLNVARGDLDLKLVARNQEVALNWRED